MLKSRWSWVVVEIKSVICNEAGKLLEPKKDQVTRVHVWSMCWEWLPNWYQEIILIGMGRASSTDSVSRKIVKGAVLLLRLTGNHDETQGTLSWIGAWRKEDVDELGRGVEPWWWSTSKSNTAKWLLLIGKVLLRIVRHVGFVKINTTLPRAMDRSSLIGRNRQGIWSKGYWQQQQTGSVLEKRLVVEWAQQVRCVRVLSY